MLLHLQKVLADKVEHHAGELFPRVGFIGDSVLDVLRSIAVETPRPLTDVAPEVPPGLAEIVMRLLAKNPADRPASAGVTADALAAQAQ